MCKRLLLKTTLKNYNSLSPWKQSIKKWVVAQKFCTLLYLEVQILQLVWMKTKVKYHTDMSDMNTHAQTRTRVHWSGQLLNTE